MRTYLLFISILLSSLSGLANELQHIISSSEDKNLSLSISPIGVTQNAISQSIDLSILGNKNTEYSLEFNHLSSSVNYANKEQYSDDELEMWKNNGKGSSINVSIKNYFKTFYVKTALYYRDQKHINRTTSRMKPGTNDQWGVVATDMGEIRDIGVALNVGNKWDFSNSNYFFSIDWIGINHSVHSIKKVGHLKESDINALNLLNLYIGTRF